MYIEDLCTSCETADKMDADMDQDLDRIKDFFISRGVNAISKLDNLRKEIDHKDTATALKGISTALPDFKRTSARDNVIGLLKISGVVASLFPGTGTVAGGMLVLCSSIIGCIWKEDSNIDSYLKSDIDEKELSGQVDGIIRSFHITEAYLSTLEGHGSLDEHDINRMMSVADINQGTKFLAYLKNKIEHLIESTDILELKKVLILTNLYTKIAILRLSQLWRMFSVAKLLSRSVTADALQNVIKTEEEIDKRFFKFLTEPDYNTVTLFTVFHPSEYPEIDMFVQSKGLEFQNLNNVLTTNRFSLQSKGLPGYVMVMSSNFWGTVWGSYSPNNNQDLFIFKPISEKDNYFTILSAKWPSWYVHLRTIWNNCAGYNVENKEPGSKANWKIIRLKDGSYMISPKEWPGKFIGISDAGMGRVVGFDSDPGQCGYWIFTPDTYR